MAIQDDTRANLLAEADRLLDSAQILRRRFTTGKHDVTATGLQKAAAELYSRARHPSGTALAAPEFEEGRP